MAMMNEMEYRTIGSALAGGYRAAVYCRLSKDDDLQGESASIANQRDMLEKYCEKQGWEVVAVYQDDGFTGLNMERPDLQRMLRAIERRQINLVITKDLSRLGRNYLQTGHLIEDFFPRNGVRYIAMNDGIDTLRDNNDIAPFKNILNEMYSKDISKKVHSSYLLKAQKGQFTGCLAPFGYRKDPEDKNHLLIDEETAPIVRLIFGYALNGHGPNYIRRRLEEEKIPCPTWWNRERGLRNTRTKWEKKDPENGRYMWDFSVIKDLLMNPVYTGAIASQKKDYRFKIGKIGDRGHNREIGVLQLPQLVQLVSDGTSFRFTVPLDLQGNPGCLVNLTFGHCHRDPVSLPVLKMALPLERSFREDLTIKLIRLHRL